MAMHTVASSTEVAYGKGTEHSLALSFQGEDEGRGKGEPQMRKEVAARDKVDRQAQV